MQDTDLNVGDCDQSITDEEIDAFNELGARVTIDLPGYGELVIVPDGAPTLEGEMSATSLRELLRLRKGFGGGWLVKTGPDSSAYDK